MPFSLEQFQSDYDAEIFPVKIGKHELRFYKPKSIDRFINPDDLMDGFPLWAKIWEASAVLVQYMADLPVKPERRILELGSGLGVAGICAAVLGHHIMLTEYNPDALNFLRANAEINHCRHLTVHHLDWVKPTLEGTFDLIIGSEIVYQESTVKALGGIFEQFLAPRGKVILAEGIRSTGAIFFEKMSARFDIRTKKFTLRSREKLETVILYELNPR